MSLNLSSFLPQESEAATDVIQVKVTDETSASEQTAVSQTEAAPSSTQEAEDGEGGAAEVLLLLRFH